MQLSLPLVDQPSAPPVSIVFVRHRRARRYILRMLGDGTLRVTLPRWGVKRDALAFVDASRDWISRQRDRSATPRPAPSPRRRDLHAIVDRWLRDRARRELPPMLLALAATHGISVSRVSIRDQRSRWGSCSPRGTIALNWRLIQVPPFVRDYVLLHELMHRRELNHSRRFWRLVAACCPRHAEARQWLRKEGKALWSDCD